MPPVPQRLGEGQEGNKIARCTQTADDDSSHSLSLSSLAPSVIQSQKLPYLDAAIPGIVTVNRVLVAVPFQQHEGGHTIAHQEPRDTHRIAKLHHTAVDSHEEVASGGDLHAVR